MRDRFLIQPRRRDRRSRQDQRLDVCQGGIDFFTNDSTARERTQVVLGEDVAALLDAQAHRRIVQLRTLLERLRVIGRALGERDDQVDAGDVVRVGKLRRRDDGAARAQALERVLVHRADAGFEQRLHVPAETAQAHALQRPDGRRAHRAPREDAVHRCGVGHRSRQGPT